MIPLRRYFIWFFVLCFLFTCICGVLAALMPRGMGGILTAVPYLVAMIWVLFKFLKQQKRAPTQTERKRFTLGFSLIFWGYNLLGYWVEFISSHGAIQRFGKTCCSICKTRNLWQWC